MGFWDTILGRRTAAVAQMSPNVTYIGGTPELDSLAILAGKDSSQLTVAELWATQPHLRTVVSFLARNMAQLGLHVFERDGDDRSRDRTSPLTRLLEAPNRDQTTYDLIYALVGDDALYDRAFWLVVSDTDRGWQLRRLPPSWVSVADHDGFGVRSYAVTGLQGTVTVPADRILSFSGYSPTDPLAVSPTIDSLRETLREQVEAARYRSQVWKRGGRVSAVIQRPKDAPEWSPEAMSQFREDWYSKFTGHGPGAGGTPILEDGMTLNRIDFNAQEQQFVEAAKLSFSTVASAFHVNPTMVGLLDDANYSNVQAFRQMLYSETLGPTLKKIEQRINAFLLPMLGMDNTRFFVEFNIAEKLKGSFEEQAAVMSTMVGAPVMTRDEGRARFNLPALGGEAAELVTPLNVLIGGQASPRDTGTQNELPKAGLPIAKSGSREFAKAAITDPQRAKINQVLTAFFDRQGKSVLSRIGTTADWWDGDRWDRELAKDLSGVARAIVGILGKVEAERLGFPDAFSAEGSVNFVQKVAERYAGNINATTKAQLDVEVEADEPNPARVFEQAKESRSDGVATGIGTFVAGLATVEAARQIAYSQGVRPMKTWLTGPNPRLEHAALDGERVPIDEPFSSGAMWPGDDGEPGCNCNVSVDF